MLKITIFKYIHYYIFLRLCANLYVQNWNMFSLLFLLLLRLFFQNLSPIEYVMVSHSFITIFLLCLFFLYIILIIVSFACVSRIPVPVLFFSVDLDSISNERVAFVWAKLGSQPI